jgi:hypothetical protein
VSEAPDWHKGDLIALPQDLLRERGAAVYRGCCVFLAEHEPTLHNDGTWRYGCRDCRELRRATLEDVDRLIRIAVMSCEREAGELTRLLNIRRTEEANETVTG